ncbi:SusF/SusE family outer membrane protein [Plebeiibacterium sediminum]|uniref:SusF/SusE family outer membrane protein n=1 Tax=Plebeiibacterium sediminum TaxID=2992112 RepID=A0AAE3SE52_9BACT|nr:SusF/SusE family outer membrane protein [Plebeiobacterium sediminum]MCW3785627.1 SusF/SusE family outer membrane protein [Plebeiobacterium sediminum]
MKNLKYLFISLLAVLFIACEDDFEKPSITEPVQGTAPVLEELSAEIDVALAKKNENETVVDLSWSAATYADPIGVRYYVQVDAAGNGFANALEFDRVSATTKSIKVGELNTLIADRYAPAVPVELDLRIKASSNEDLDDLYSGSVTITVTPYLDVAVPTELYIYGSATASAEVTDGLAAYGADDVFTKYLKLTKDGVFQFSDVKESSGFDYNVGKFATLSDNIVAAGDEAGNFKFTGETGWYVVTADFVNSNLTIEAYDSYVSDYPNIYLVGDYNAVDPAWSPGTAPEMTRKSEGVYSIEVPLKDGAAFKFINQQNWDGLDWADADSEGNSGILAPKGKNNDIKFDGADAEYTITLDLNKGIYTIEAVPVFPTAMYMIGSFVGWSWDNAVEMIPVHSNPHLFWKIVWFDAGSELKFNSAKAWDGGEFGKTGDNGDAEGVWSRGGDNIPIATEGYKMVVVNLLTNTIQITDPAVYGMGTAFGDWTTGVFTFSPDPADAKILVSPAAVADDNARMYVTATTLTNADGNVVDWWQAEFNVYPGGIEYRGTGNDQAAAPILTGQQVKLNFSTETGVFE